MHAVLGRPAPEGLALPAEYTRIMQEGDIRLVVIKVSVVEAATRLASFAGARLTGAKVFSGKSAAQRSVSRFPGP